MPARARDAWRSFGHDPARFAHNQAWVLREVLEERLGRVASSSGETAKLLHRLGVAAKRSDDAGGAQDPAGLCLPRRPTGKILKRELGAMVSV